MAYYLFIAIGGALGAVGRYWLMLTVERLNPGPFPVGTFIVNVIGSLLIGVLFVVLSEKIQLAAHLRPLLMIGFLGALTTFSTFSLDAFLLIEQGHIATAITYLLASVLVCLLAVSAGIGLTRLLF